MRELALGETEASLQILREVFRLLDFFNDGFVDSLLVCRLGFGVCLLRFRLAISKEFLLGRYPGGGAGLGEVRVVDLVVNLIVVHSKAQANSEI